MSSQLKYKYQLTFKTLSYLHIGAPLAEADNNLLFDRDCEGKPYISSTTLKGFLRRNSRYKEGLYGTSHDSKNAMRAKVIVFGATIDAATEVINHNSINQGSNVSLDAMLFSREYIPPHSTFFVEAILKADSEENIQQFETDLRHLAQIHGVPVGAAKSKGFGYIQLASAKRCQYAGRKEVSAYEDIVLAGQNHDQELRTYTFRCPGPFFTGVKHDEAEDKASNEMSTRRRGGQAEVLGSMITGALRAKASSLFQLSDVEKLFGSTSKASQFQIVSVSSERTGGIKIPKIRIHRVLGGVDKGPLFRDCDYGVKIEIKYKFLRDPEAREALEALFEEIDRTGIFIGGMNSTGYGWFNFPQPKKPPELNQEDFSQISNISLTDLGRVQRKAKNNVQPQNFASYPVPNFVTDASEEIKDLYTQNPVSGLGPHNADFSKSYSGIIDYTLEFETPFFTGAAEGKDPLQIGGNYVISGATIKGTIRNFLEFITNSRIHEPDFDENTIDAEPAKSNKEREKLKKRKEEIEEYNKNIEHKFNAISELKSPTPYIPDLVESVFGYSIEGEQSHEDHHLGSRVYFDFAHAITDLKTVRKILTLGTPKAKKSLYPKASRKIYFIQKPKPNDWTPAKTNSKPKPSQCEANFLAPKNYPNENIARFQSRIYVHNLNEVELGLLIYLFEKFCKNEIRLKMGYAKPMGFGQFRMRPFNFALKVKETNGKDSKDTEVRDIENRDLVSCKIAFNNHTGDKFKNHVNTAINLYKLPK